VLRRWKLGEESGVDAEHCRYGDLQYAANAICVWGLKVASAVIEFDRLLEESESGEDFDSAVRGFLGSSVSDTDLISEAWQARSNTA